MVRSTEKGTFKFPILTPARRADGNVTTYQYDPNDRRTAVIDPQGDTAAYAFDGDGRLTLATDYDGRQIQDAYDPDGNLTQEVWAPKTSSAGRMNSVAPAVGGPARGNEPIRVGNQMYDR